LLNKIIEEAKKIRQRYINEDGIIGNCHEICLDLNKKLKLLRMELL